MWLNDENYMEYLKGLTVVEVSGESCANCLTLMPILNNLLGNRDDVKLYHLEAKEDTPLFLEKYEIRAVPTILVFYNDQVEARCKGFQPEEILEIWLDAKFDEIKKKHNI